MYVNFDFLLFECELRIVRFFIVEGLDKELARNLEDESRQNEDDPKVMEIEVIEVKLFVF